MNENEKKIEYYNDHLSLLLLIYSLSSWSSLSFWLFDYFFELAEVINYDFLILLLLASIILDFFIEVDIDNPLLSS